MKKVGRFLLFTLCAAALLTGLGALTPDRACAQDARTILVTGKGGIKAAPDIAFITLESSTKRSEAQAAQNENNQHIAAIIAAMQAAGIAEKDINTYSYYLNQNTTYNNGIYRSEGYTASCAIRITVREVSRAGEIIDAAVRAGASRINGLQFSISDPTPYYAQALAAAVKDAQDKARVLAQALGMSVKAVVAVEEQATSYTPIAYTNSSTNELAFATSMPVQADELSITASIKVTFAIE